MKAIGKVLAKIFVQTPAEKELAEKVRRERLIILFTLIVMHGAVAMLFDPLKTEEEATIYEGVLTEVHINRRSRGIELETAEGSVSLVVYHDVEFVRSLQSYIGTEVKAWGYTRLSTFFLPEKRLIQFAVDNEKMLDSWNEIAINGRKPKELYFIAICLAIIALSTNKILKTHTRIEQSQNFLK